MKNYNVVNFDGLAIPVRRITHFEDIDGHVQVHWLVHGEVINMEIESMTFDEALAKYKAQL